MAECREKPCLKVQEFLRNYSLDELLRKYKLTARRHPQYTNLVLLRYDQQASPFEEEIVQECRGLILDEKKNWKVVAYPYKKFFNYGETYAAKLDWSTAVVYEKLDGSLATLYYYDKTWHVSSSGVPDASGRLKCGLTFCELFWDVWGKLKYKLPKDRNKCYMFELVSPRNIILCKPSKEELIFHGCRDLQNLKELNPMEIGAANNWSVVKSYPMKDLLEVVEAANKLNPAIAEGFVVCDASFQRIKVKSPSYVALSHLAMRDERRLNYKHMLNLVRTNESSEFLSYFPEWRGLYNRVRSDFTTLCSQIQSELDKVKGEVNWRELLEENLQRHPHKELYIAIADKLFNDEQETVEDYLKKCSLEVLWTLTEFCEGRRSRNVPSKSAAASTEDLLNSLHIEDDSAEVTSSSTKQIGRGKKGKRKA